MKNLYQMISDRVSNPSGVDVVIAVIITILFGNLTGEVISREFNSYLQAGMMIGTLFVGVLTIRMTAVYIYNYINQNQNQNQ